MAGKGDDPRPKSISEAEFSERWPLEKKPAPRGFIYRVGVGWVAKERDARERPLLTQ